MTNVTLRHSYSALKLYENCPLRYYHQRVAKTVTDPGSEASLHGERVHKSFEERIKTETPLPPALARHELLVAALETAAKDRNWQLSAEQELTINSYYKPTGWWAEDAWLRAKLDVLVITGSTALTLDWKTGKRRPDFLQMEVFALMVLLHYPEVQTVKASFVWLRDDATDNATYTRDDEPKLIVGITQRVSRIEKSLREDTWPAKPSGLCRFCPCATFCEFKSTT